jgi:group I intron endonuclease
MGKNYPGISLPQEIKRATQKRSFYISLINNYVKYIVYKTTNLITGQYYIGKHKQLVDTFDGYFGSSPSLNEDISKHGVEHFVRETLYEFSNEDECYAQEILSVSDKWKTDNLCYNKQPGGKGFSSGCNHYSAGVGFSMQHKKNLSKSRKTRPLATEETREKMSMSRTGSKRNAETKKRMSAAQTGEKNPMFGKKHTEEKRKEIGEKLRGKYTGEKCSRFKGYYITPFGKFATVKDAANNITEISRSAIREWCLQSDKQITKSMIGNSKYLQECDLGKSFKDLGFYFKHK